MLKTRIYQQKFEEVLQQIKNKDEEIKFSKHTLVEWNQ